jgi:hypothetical protein
MTWMPIDGAGKSHRPEPKAPQATVSSRLYFVGMVLRILFIACLLAITVRVAMPQNETIWTVYDTPGDLVRLILGFAVCAWVTVQFFSVPMPKDPHSQRTWVYFGLAAVPFAVLCLMVVW